MSSSSLYHPFCLFVSSLIFLLLHFSGDVLSVAVTVSPNVPKAAASKAIASRPATPRTVASRPAAPRTVACRAAACRPGASKAASKAVASKVTASKAVASKVTASKTAVSRGAASKAAASKTAAYRGAASRAATRAINIGRRNKQLMEFLNAHNIARVASGVTNLKWDQELARFASNWAKQRMSDCKMTHSDGPYGENIFWYQNGINWSPRKVVTKWVEENVNYNRITNTCAPGKMCGHYTQVIWRTTTAVGCARTKCNNNLGFLVVCEYSPGGNFEGETPFDAYM